MILKELRGPTSEKQYQDIDFYIKGGMGEIYTAIEQKTKTKKALKILPIDNQEEYNLLKTEFDISISLKHKNIIDAEYYDEFEYKGTTYLYCVMEFYENGSLREYIKSQSNQLYIKHTAT